MSENTITVFNLILHGLLLAALGLVVVVWSVRDARRRAHAALMALLFTVIAPWAVSAWPSPYRVPEAPVLTQIHQVLQTEWRIKVEAAPEPSQAPAIATVKAVAPAWTMNDGVRLLRWLWWAGFAIMALQHAWQTWKAWRWSLRKPTDEEMKSVPTEWQSTPLRVFEHGGSPCVSGLLRPVIAVPASAFQELNQRQWHWLLRHEGEHVRGGDVAHLWLLGWVRAFAWWNPFVHALIEQWARAREQVCDAVALGEAEPAEPYAEFLLDVAAGRHVTEPGTVPMAQSRPARRLRARLSALLSAQKVRARVGWGYLIGAATSWVLGYALISSVGIAVQAQNEEPGVKAATVSASKAETGLLFTRTFKVRPDLLSVNNPPVPAAPNSDPFAPQVVPRLTAKQWLEKQGVAFPKDSGAAAVFNPVTLQLIVKQTEPALQQVADIVAVANTNPPQIMVSTRFIQGPQWYGTHGQAMSKVEVESLLKSVAQRKGIDLASGPTVTTRMGQRAVVEVVREGIVKIETDSYEAKMAGVQVELDPSEGANGEVQIGIAVSLHKDAKREVAWDLSNPETIDWPSVTTVRGEWTSSFATGQTRVFRLAGSPHPVTVLITAEAMTGYGEPAASFAERIKVVADDGGASLKLEPANAYDKRVREAQEGVEEAKRVAAEQAKKQVYLSAKIVDVTHDKDTPFDFLNLDILNNKLSDLQTPVRISEQLQATEHVIKAMPPQIVSLAGIFTDPQFQVALRALSRRKGADLASTPTFTTASGKPVEMIFPAIKGKGAIHVMPTIGPDGYTLDLDLKVDMEQAAGVAQNQSQITTSVSIWDGQTIVLGGLLREDDRGKHTRLIFVTGRIVDPKGQPAK